MTGRLIALFLCSLIFGLIQNAPVGKVLALALPADAGIELYELSGSVLRGEAGYVRARGVGAKDVRWELKPAQLLLLKLAADIEVSAQSRDLAIDNAWLFASISKPLFSDVIRLRDVEATAALEAVQQALKIPFLPVSGQIQLDLDDVRIRGQFPETVRGSARFFNAQWTLGRPAPLGSYQAEISTAEGQILALIADGEDGRVALEGEASLDAQRQYQLRARLKPKLETPTPVANNMKALGRTDSQGWYSFSQQGAL